MESAAKQEEKPAPLPQKQKKRKNSFKNMDEQMILFESEQIIIEGKKTRFIKTAENGGIASHFGGGFGVGRGRGRLVVQDQQNFASNLWPMVMQDQPNRSNANPELINDSPNPDAGNDTVKKNEDRNKSELNINQNLNRNQVQNSDKGEGQGGHGIHFGQGGQQEGGQDGNHGLRVRGGGGRGGPYDQQWDNRNRSGQRSGGPAGKINSVLSGGGGGPGGGRGGEDFVIAQRLLSLAGPTLELPPVDISAETKFSGRNRLYVGNISKDITDEELRQIFKPYGEIDDISKPSTSFAFLKVDYHSNAEKAKRALDGSMHKGRQLRVRFAFASTILRVSNLTQYVTNELLHKSFEIFGPIERAIITVDERGRHTGEGVVEFVKKSSALACLRLCNAKCFFLTASPRPCLVEPMVVTDDNDGLPERTINCNSPDFFQERSIGPRFADRNSFEHEYGSRWKQLHFLFKTKHDALKRELRMEEDKLEAQVEYARYDQETEFLRQELRKREVNSQHKKLEWEMREKQVEDMRKREEESMWRLQGQMPNNKIRQEENMRRWQQGIQGFGGDGENGNSPFELFKADNSTLSGNNSGPAGGTIAQDSFAFDFGGNNMNQGGNQRGYNGGGRRLF